MVGTTAAIIAASIAAGGSVASGALANRGKKSTSTSTPTYTPEQQQLQQQLSGALMKRTQPRDFTPQKTAAIGNVNKTFRGAEARLEKSLTSRGMGSSGAFEKGKKDLEIARGGAIGDLESQFAGIELADQDRGFDLASRFAFANPGQTNEGTQSGNMLGGAVNGGLETAMFLYGLQQMTGGMFGNDDYSGPYPQGRN